MAVTAAQNARTPERARRAGMSVAGLLTAVSTWAPITAHLPVAWVQWTAVASWLSLTYPAIARSRRPARPSLNGWVRSGIVVAGLAWSVLSVARPTFGVGDGLTGRYYAGLDLLGEPIDAGADGVPSSAQIAARWGNSLPASFSVLWSGFITVPSSGDYHFSLRSDDDAWLYVDNVLVVDNGAGPHGPATVTGMTALAAGAHRVRLQYVQRGGGYELSWQWASGDGVYRPVPRWTLSRRNATYGAVLAARAADLLRQFLGLALVTALLWEERHTGAWLAASAASAVRAHFTMRAVPVSTFLLLAYAALLLLPPGDGLFRAAVAGSADLARAAFSAVTQPSAFAAKVSTPLAGREQVLPAEVVNMTALLERRRPSSYRLSNSLSSNQWVFQQMVASAWPRLMEPTARTLFLRSGDQLPDGCAPLERVEDIILADCP